MNFDTNNTDPIKKMTEVYFGNLPKDLRRGEVEDFFRGFGRILDVEIKSGFAFVTIEDRRDAEDAVRKLDGSRFCQSRVTVDISKGKPRGAIEAAERRGGRDGGSRGPPGSFGDFGRGGRGFDRRDDRRDDYGRGGDRYGRDDRRGGDRDSFGSWGRGGRDGGRDGGFGGRSGGFGGRDGGFGGGRGGRGGGFGGERRTNKTKFSLLAKNLRRFYLGSDYWA